MKIALIVDGGSLPRFKLDALDAVEGAEEVTVFSRTNARLTRRSPLRHGAYYALGLLTLRNPLTRFVPVAASRKRIAATISFETPYEGGWQVLPPEIVTALREGGFDVILKFSEGSLRAPPAAELPVPMLSYHHGDPDHYRGGPAGFWEMAKGDAAMGQVIQVVTDGVDAGPVVAFAETKVLPWSYRGTLIESYRHSPLIINEAIRNALSGTRLPRPCTGSNRGLPSTLTVAAFVARMAVCFAARLLYGAAMEKKWHVSLASCPPSGPIDLIGRGTFPRSSDWQTLEAGKDHVFYADPFFSSEPPGILVEALKAGSGLGEIVLVGEGGSARVSELPGHLSYPSTLRLAGRQLVVPEMANFSPQRVFVLEAGAMKEIGPLPLEREERLVDPTLTEHEGRLYLFANIKRIGSNALYLWSANSLEGPFSLHPLSPIRVSPSGARMGGSLLRYGGRLYRLGQDFRSGYGDGLFAFEIEALSADDYRERLLGSLRFTKVRGPHTLNVEGDRLLFDWYEDRFSPLAGPRRLLAKLRSRSAARPQAASPNAAPRAPAPDLPASDRGSSAG